ERAIADVVAAYPAAEKHTVIASDEAWFVDLLRGNGKPPAFVPVIDSDVRRWWRQDSLWQAHDERYTAEQVGIIPGTTAVAGIDRKSTRLNSSHVSISYAVFCLKKKKNIA